MITFLPDQNMFDDQVSAMVNTVNCTGTMGGGLARTFRDRYPEMNSRYRQACLNGELVPGTLHIDREENEPYRWIVNFPTKNEIWLNSRIEYIRDGMDALVAWIKANGVDSIGIPPLGCGLGRLNWNEVLPIIREKVAELDNVDVHIYGPNVA